jgi:very-short-patch-repair endonuclease
MDLLLARRRMLRRQSTEAERVLWRTLRMRQFRRLKFRRQHPLGPYIVDFYCASRRLVVELDGGRHFTAEGKAYDQRRTDYLASRGVQVFAVHQSRSTYEHRSRIGRAVAACGRLILEVPLTSPTKASISWLMINSMSPRPAKRGEGEGEGRSATTKALLPKNPATPMPFL